MLNKEEFIKYAKNIEEGVHYIDNASDCLQVELWDSDMGQSIDSAIELLVLAAGFDITDDSLMEAVFDAFWHSREFDDDKNYWSNYYDRWFTKESK